MSTSEFIKFHLKFLGFNLFINSTPSSKSLISSLSLASDTKLHELADPANLAVTLPLKILTSLDTSTAEAAASCPIIVLLEPVVKASPACAPIIVLSSPVVIFSPD